MAHTENFAVLKKIYEDNNNARKKIAPSVYFEHETFKDIWYKLKQQLLKETGYTRDSTTHYIQVQYSSFYALFTCASKEHKYSDL